MAKALAPEVSTWPDENPQLIGSRCGACGATTWPMQDHCPRCSGPNMSELLLPRRGTLVAWTTQGFVPKLPYAGGETAETFQPFAVGLVQLGDDVRVEARLTESDPAKLRFGMDVELVLVPFFVDKDGTEIITWAFQPV
ncbi:MAG: OB-fold domain-containing protein [Mycobacteriaceae bacterium]|nr:OB-fold domain-containing protein [Mycobacteriaceae bacterium]